MCLCSSRILRIPIIHPAKSLQPNCHYTECGMQSLPTRPCFSKISLGNPLPLADCQRLVGEPAAGYLATSSYKLVSGGLFMEPLYLGSFWFTGLRLKWLKHSLSLQGKVLLQVRKGKRKPNQESLLKVKWYRTVKSDTLKAVLLFKGFNQIQMHSSISVSHRIICTTWKLNSLKVVTVQLHLLTN